MTLDELAHCSLWGGVPCAMILLNSKESPMTKRLHSVRIYYDVMVVAEEYGEFPINIAKENLCNIFENEQPKIEYNGSVHSVNKDNPWRYAIPYGDADGKPSYYYTTEAEKERKEVVKKVQGLLTKEEWDALTTQLCNETN